MASCNPNLTLHINLKNQIIIALRQVIQLLESQDYCVGDRNQLDYAFFRLEQVLYLCTSANEVINFMSDEILEMLWIAYNSLNELFHSNVRKVSSCQQLYTGLVGRPTLDVPRETLKLYLNYGWFLCKKNFRNVRNFNENNT